MVRIVEHIPDPSVVKRKVCYHCGVMLEYVPKDIRQRVTRDYLGDSDVDYVIDCPNCQTALVVRR